jgi:non-heme chloroperoxidase
MRVTISPDVSIHATDIPGPGRTVVLLHAWGLNSTIWHAQIAMLTAAGHRAVAIDRRGHGRSDIADDGYDDLATLAADVNAVLEQLDLTNIVLLGHSVGGLEAVAVAAGPSGHRLSGLVLSAPTTPCLTAGPDNALGAPAELFEASRAAMRADLAGWIVANTPGYWGTGIERELETIWTQQTLYSTPLHVLLGVNTMMTGADVRPALARISVPAIVLHGDADLSAPVAITGHPTAASLKHGRLVLIEGAGHGLYTSYTDRYNKELQTFIATV